MQARFRGREQKVTAVGVIRRQWSKFKCEYGGILEMRGYTLPHLISEIIWCSCFQELFRCPIKK